MKNLFLIWIALLISTSAMAQQGYGVNIHQAAGQTIQIMRNMGATWVRVSHPWGEVERSANNYDFAWSDYMLRDLKSRGMKVFYILGYPPSFWSSNGQSNGVPNRNAWIKYVDTMTTRYRDYVDVWEIHNEPNLKEFWAGTMREYIEVLLKPASPIIRRNAPNSQIAAPGVTHIHSSKPGNYLKELRKYGALETFDVVSYHLYSKSKPADFRKDLLESRWGKPSVQKVLQDAGLTGKPFWLTEFGCDLQETRSETANANCIYEKVRILKSIPWITGFFIYNLTDGEAGPQKWGLLRGDLSPTPSVPRLKPLFQ
ncbi:MAG: cellulase family glycosylhydrolase [Bdellovibrionales bacterium]